MNPELRPGSPVRKGGSSEIWLSIMAARAPFRQGADLGDRERQAVGDEGDRFCVEITAGEHFADRG